MLIFLLIFHLNLQYYLQFHNHIIYMQPSQFSTYNNQQEIFDSCYNQNDPYSLTITKKPKILFDYLYKPSTYIWIIDNPPKSQTKKNQLYSLKNPLLQIDGPLTLAQQQQIQKLCGVKIDFVNAIDDILKYSNNSLKNIIICHNCFYLNKKIETVLKPMLQNNKIFSLILYGDQLIRIRINQLFKYKVNFQFCHSTFSVLKSLENSIAFNSSSEFVNFISLQKQKWDSNILVKTLFAMIRQNTNVNHLMEKFKQSAIRSFPMFQEDIKQFFGKFYNLTDKEIIQQYTKQSFIHHFINRILRVCKDPTCIYIIQPYFKSLFNAIRKIYSKQKSKVQNFICYRGGQISEKQIQMFKQNKGLLIQNLGFMSTSRNKQIAKAFTKNALFQIQVDCCQKKPQVDYGFANIMRFSSQKNEEEILFNPLNSFQVVDFWIKPDYSQKQGYLIKLKYGELARVAAVEKNKLTTPQQQNMKSFAEHQIRQTQQQSSDIGQVLISTGYNMQGSEQYANKFLELAEKFENQKIIVDAHFLKVRIAYNKGDYKTAEQYSTILLSILQKMKVNGKEQHQKIQINRLKILNHLGIIFDKMGEYKKAVDYKLKCLQKIKRILGEDHPEYTSTLGTLGNSFSNMGQYKKAVDYKLKCLQIQKRTLGEDHPEYASSLGNLGIIFNKIGQYKKAVDYLLKCLQITKRTLGEEHPNYASTLGSIGNIFCHMGQYKKAVDYLLKCLQITKRTLGGDSPQYSKILNNLGSTFNKMAQYKKAVDYLLKSLQITRRTLGQDHPDYASALGNLGNIFDKMGEYKKAVDYLLKCLQIQKRTLGQDHPDYASTLGNLGSTYSNMGQQKKAVDYLLKCLQIQKRTLGQDYPGYASTLNNLASTFHSMGYYKRAEDYLLKCLQIQKRTLGQDHPDYASTLGNLGNTYIHIGQYKKAVDYKLKCLQIQKRTLGQDHSDYVLTLNNLGVNFLLMGQLKRAGEYLQKCLQITKRTLGEQHPNYASTLNNLGSTFSNMGQQKTAVDYYLKCLQIQKRTLGQDHPDYALTVRNIGSTFNQISQYKKAMEYYLKFLQIQKRTLGEDHPNYASILGRLGSTFDSVCQYNKAVDYKLKCLQIIKRVLGEDHPDYASTLNNLGNTYFHKGQYNKAVDYFRKCLQKTRRELRENHQVFLLPFNNLCHLYLEMGQAEEAFNTAEKSGDQNLKASAKQLKQQVVFLEKSKKNEMNNLSFVFQNQIKQLLMEKKYSQAIRMTNIFLRIGKKLTNCYRWILIQRMELQRTIYLLQASKQIQQMCKLARKYESYGMYEQAEQQYTRTLQKHSQMWKQIPQLMALIESQVENLRQAEEKQNSSYFLLPFAESFKNKEENIIKEVQQQQHKGQHEDQEQQYEQEVDLLYYLDTCQESVSQIANTFPDQPFEFQMYSQVLSSIQEVDIETATTAMDIIVQQQNQCQQLQETSIGKQLRTIMTKLNNLFRVMLDIYAGEHKFSEKFKKVQQELRDTLKKANGKQN